MNIPEGDDSDYVKIAEIVVAAHAEVGKPGAFLADLLPSMKYIPAWFPGAGWKRKANYWRKLGECFVHMPWNIVKEQLVGYISLILGRVPTFRTEARYSRTLHCSQSLIEKLPDETSPDRAEEEMTARNTCAVAFAGEFFRHHQTQIKFQSILE